jgi:O-antigen/teichoic acid export membrane protein
MDSHSSQKNITQKATRSVKWSALMEAVSKTAAPIIMVILARLLTPEDFGVVAIAMIAISFAQMFWDGGLSKALIQTNENPQEAAHVVFWTNLCLGIVVYVFLFLMAPWVAVFFKSPTSAPVLRVLGLQIVFASLSSVQQALFVRDLNFRSLFWIKLTTAFFPGLFSIPLACYGYGVWALVCGSLSGQFLNLILLWCKSNWRPQLCFDIELARKLFRFGLWVVGESLAVWFIMWGDNLLVGKFMGPHELGVYRTGWSLVMIIFGLTLNPFLPVLYPTFSRFQDNLPALKATFHKVNRLVMALALPIGAGLLLTGRELEKILFGAKWQGLGVVLCIIGLQQALSWMISINIEVYRAMGRPDINTKLIFVTALLYLPAYAIAAQFGLNAFVYTRLIITLPSILIGIYLCVHMLRMSPFYLWHEGKYIILATLFMGTIVMILKNSISTYLPDVQAIMVVPILIIIGVLVYISSLWLMDRPFIIQTKGQIMYSANS